jgi:hypothetical protein
MQWILPDCEAKVFEPLKGGEKEKSCQDIEMFTHLRLECTLVNSLVLRVTHSRREAKTNMFVLSVFVGFIIIKCGFDERPVYLRRPGNDFCRIGDNVEKVIRIVFI